MIKKEDKEGWVYKFTSLFIFCFKKKGEEKET